MPLPNQPWITSYPASQDTVGVEQPDLSNDSTPGALDGHRVLAEHLHALRDKLQDVADEVGSIPGSAPAGCLRARVATLEAASSQAFNEEELISTGTETSKVLTNAAAAAAGATSGYALSVYRNGKRMRYQASPSSNDHYSYTAGTKTVNFLASGTADEYHFEYWS